LIAQDIAIPNSQWAQGVNFSMFSHEDASSESDTGPHVAGWVSLAENSALGAHTSIHKDGPEIPDTPRPPPSSSSSSGFHHSSFTEAGFHPSRPSEIQCTRHDVHYWHNRGPQERQEPYQGRTFEIQLSLILGEGLRYLSRQCSIKMRLVNTNTSFGRDDMLSLPGARIRRERYGNPASLWRGSLCSQIPLGGPITQVDYDMIRRSASFSIHLSNKIRCLDILHPGVSWWRLLIQTKSIVSTVTRGRMCSRCSLHRSTTCWT
jgi:hypothetical protein